MIIGQLNKINVIVGVDSVYLYQVAPAPMSWVYLSVAPHTPLIQSRFVQVGWNILKLFCYCWVFTTEVKRGELQMRVSDIFDNQGWLDVWQIATSWKI